MTCKLTAILEQDRDGVFAYCPELKGCHTQGDTVEEALANLQEAAELSVPRIPICSPSSLVVIRVHSWFN